MENEKKINWLGLFIKIVIIFIFIIIVVWLISKIINKSRLSETFVRNINNIQDISADYFKTVDLPLEKGKSIKITLKEMIEKDLLKDKVNNIENSCDLNNSFSKITRQEKEYNIETTLKCGKEKDSITTKLRLKDCKNCNVSESNDSIEENNQENSDNSSQNTEVNTVTYYEHVKETTTYSKWMKGNKTGDNIENKYEYYGIAYKEYYSLGMINKKDTKDGVVRYTLKLENIPNSSYYFTTVEESNYFNNELEKVYLNEKDVTMKNNNMIEVTEIEKYSLKEENFTYKLSPYYRKGSFYVDVKITIKNTNNVKSYYDKETKKEMYLVPIYFVINFASNQILETKPTGEYATITYYRYIEKNKEVIWTTETYVEGYTKTGKTK